MTDALEVLFADTFGSVIGSPLMVGLFLLGVFIIWLIVTKMDRVGIVFVGFVTIGTLTKIGLIPEYLFAAAVILAALITTTSFFRSTGDQ